MTQDYRSVMPMHKRDATASDTAQEALIMSTKALTQIEYHEEICGARWSLLTKLMLLVLAKLGALLLFLLSDKMGWFAAL